MRLWNYMSSRGNSMVSDQSQSLKFRKPMILNFSQGLSLGFKIWEDKVSVQRLSYSEKEFSLSVLFLIMA